MANAYALHLQYARQTQAMKLVLKAFLDKLVIGILYDEGCNSLILNNRLCFSFQAISNKQLRTRATNSWKEYRNKFYTDFVWKWTLQGPESPEVQSILMSLRQEFKGPKWDAKVNKLISLSTEKRIRLMAEGKHEEAEALNNALRKTVAQVTHYGLEDENIGFESTLTTQAPQPKESKTEGRIGREISAYMKESSLRMDCGLGDGGVGFESTTIMQVPQPIEKIEGKIGEEVFAYTKKSTPGTDYGLSNGDVEFGSTPITRVPQSNANKTAGQVDEEVFAYTKKSSSHTDYSMRDGDVGFESARSMQAPQPKENKIGVQIGEEVFSYTRKSTPRTDYGLEGGDVESKFIPSTQVPQPKESEAEGQIGGEFSVYAKKYRPHTDYSLGDGDVEFESALSMQAPRPKKNKIEPQIGEEVFSYTKKSTPRKRSKESTDKATPQPARKARRTQSALPAKLNRYGIGSEPSGNFDPQVVFVHTRKQPSEPSGDFDPRAVFVHTRNQPAALQTKRAPATIIPTPKSGQFAAVTTKPTNEGTESLERAA